MDRRPIVAVDAPLDSTAASLAAAARRAGYTVTTQKVVMRRAPRQVGQAEEWIVATMVSASAGDWHFLAMHNDRDGWDIVQHRPGWPVAPSNVTALRATLAAQTPVALK